MKKIQTAEFPHFIELSGSKKRNNALNSEHT